MANKKVLIVDDEIHIVQVVAIKLKNNGFDVITAENGQEALDAAISEKPDLIITDFQMPIMNGLELVEKLRAEPDIADTPVIMLTARGFALEDGQKETLAVSDCLSKPFSPRELLEKVESVVKQTASV